MRKIKSFKPLLLYSILTISSLLFVCSQLENFGNNLLVQEVNQKNKSSNEVRREGRVVHRKKIIATLDSVDNNEFYHFVKADGGETSSSFNIYYSLDLNDLLNDLFIGNWNLLREDGKKKYLHSTIINQIKETSESLGKVESEVWSGPFKEKYDYILIPNIKLFQKSVADNKSENLLSNVELTLNNETIVKENKIHDESEYTKIHYKSGFFFGDYEEYSGYRTSIYWSFKNNPSKIKIILKKTINIIASETKDWAAYNDIKLGYTIYNKNSTFDADITLPYTINDVENFKALFKQIFDQKIVLEDVISPVIFEYSQNGTNEKKVRQIIDERIKKFYNSVNILNKLGPVSIRGGTDSKYSYTNDKNVSEIRIIGIEQLRGKPGKQTITIKFQLKNGRKFYFDNKPSDGVTVPLDIHPILIPEIDYKIDELVSFEPYISVGNKQKDYLVIKNDFRHKLSENFPDPRQIKSFKHNINQVNNIGEYDLIPIEKLPIIEKHGTVIEVGLEIKLGNIIIPVTIRFDRIYGNGKAFSFIDLNNYPQYQNSNIEISNHQIDFAIELNGTEINLYNLSPIIINSSQITSSSCQINIVSKSALIPTEQLASKSKWVLKNNEKNYLNEDGTNLRYVGCYETFDPFLFRLKAVQIPVYDPITGEILSYASKYKPFIRQGLYIDSKNNSSESDSKDDDTIFPRPQNNDNDPEYFANLGTYVMSKKTAEGSFNFQIVIKEYDEEAQGEQKYTKERWIIDIKMNLLNSKANFNMLGYKGNEIINKENDEKYFNQESEHYRGEFANKDTGMYIPKIVWVNANPPENFLYDPLNEQGELIVPKIATDEQRFNARYDVGYIAELNATAFSENDYNSNPSFGGYETIFDTQQFKPNGVVPYSEFYTFNDNDNVPLIEKTPLSQSGLQTIKSTADFRQVVLKRPESNNYLYQFIKISNKINNAVNEVQNYGSDIIGLYGNRKGLQNKPLFVDFWQTYQGQHLMKYLITDYQIFKNEQEVKALPYHDVIQYWNIYVNDPSNYDNSTQQTSEYDISKLQFNYFTTSQTNKIDLKRKVVEIITDELNNKIRQQGWISNTRYLEYNKDFVIEQGDALFDAKVQKLVDQYYLPLDKAKTIDFNIIIIDQAFENDLIKISGSNEIKILNNKDIDKIIDLQKFGNNKLLINTLDQTVFNPNNLVSDVKKRIYESIEQDFLKMLHNNDFLSDDYFPQLNRDYKLLFYTKVYENSIEKKHYFSSIEKAISSVLLYNSDTLKFDNNLFIDIEAIFDDKAHFFKNSYTKWVNNKSDNKNITVYPFDLSQVKKSFFKINSEHQDFLVQENKTKVETIYDLILQKALTIVKLESRKWSNAYNHELNINLDYNIRFVKQTNDDGTKLYFDNYTQAIEQALLTNIDQTLSFDNNLEVEVYAVDYPPTFIAKGEFSFIVNNSNINKSIDDEIIVINENNNNLDNQQQQIKDQNHNLTNDDVLSDNLINNAISYDNNKTPIYSSINNLHDISLWWVISPISVLILIITVTVIFIRIRRNRKIR